MSRVTKDPFWVRYQQELAQAGITAFSGRRAGRTNALRAAVKKSFGDEKARELDETGETIIEVEGKKIRVVCARPAAPKEGGAT